MSASFTPGGRKPPRTPSRAGTIAMPRGVGTTAASVPGGAKPTATMSPPPRSAKVRLPRAMSRALAAGVPRSRAAAGEGEAAARDVARVRAGDAEQLRRGRSEGAGLVRTAQHAPVAAALGAG